MMHFFIVFLSFVSILKCEVNVGEFEVGITVVDFGPFSCPGAMIVST